MIDQNYQQFVLQLETPDGGRTLDEWHWFDPGGREITFWLSGGTDIYLLQGQSVWPQLAVIYPILGPVERVNDPELNYLSVQYLGDLGSGGYSRGAPGGGVTFSTTAPGYLTEDSGDYYAYWRVSETHHGYTKNQAKNLVASQLNSDAGWKRAGITFIYDEDLAAVEYKVVVEATCDAPESACTHYDYNGDGYNFVELEYAYLNGSLGVGNLVNHETAHAYFQANHSGTGIMADFDNNRPAWPTPDDIQSVRDWLGL